MASLGDLRRDSRRVDAAAMVSGHRRGPGLDQPDIRTERTPGKSGGELTGQPPGRRGVAPIHRRLRGPLERVVGPGVVRIALDDAQEHRLGLRQALQLPQCLGGAELRSRTSAESRGERFDASSRMASAASGRFVLQLDRRQFQRGVCRQRTPRDRRPVSSGALTASSVRPSRWRAWARRSQASCFSALAGAARSRADIASTTSANRPADCWIVPIWSQARSIHSAAPSAPARGSTWSARSRSPRPSRVRPRPYRARSAIRPRGNDRQGSLVGQPRSREGRSSRSTHLPGRSRPSPGPDDRPSWR